MTTVDDVIRECGDTIDDVAHEVIRLRSQLAAATTQSLAHELSAQAWQEKAEAATPIMAAWYKRKLEVALVAAIARAQFSGSPFGVHEIVEVVANVLTEATETTNG